MHLVGFHYKNKANGAFSLILSQRRNYSVGVTWRSVMFGMVPSSEVTASSFLRTDCHSPSRVHPNCASRVVIPTVCSSCPAWHLPSVLYRLNAVKFEPKCAMAQSINHQRFSVESGFDSTSVHIWFVVDKVALTKDFPDYYIFPCQDHSSNAPYGPHSSELVVICIVLLLFVLFCVLFVCKCVLYFSHQMTSQLQLTNISYHTHLFITNGT